MFSATKLVVAGAIVALFGGYLLAGVLTQPSDASVPAVGSSASREAITGPTLITLPDELPDGVESGTIQTPAGSARWVHMTGGIPTPDDLTVEQLVPAARALVPWDDGVAAMGSFGLWTTSDGVDWDAVPLPVEDPGPFARRVLKRLGDTYVLVFERFPRFGSGQPFGIWTAKELDGDWRELDLSAVMAAAPGAGWQASKARLAAGPVELDDGRIVFSISREYRLPRKALGLPLPETKRMKRLSDGRYALCGQGKCSDGGAKAKWIVRFTQTDAGLAVVNHKSGKRLGRIDGATLSELYEGATNVLVDSFAIDGEEVVPVDDPWPVLHRGDPAWATGRDVVVAPDGSTALFRSWDSRSRLRPGDPGVPTVARVVPRPQVDLTRLWVSEVPDRLTVELVALGRGGEDQLGAWESTDGRTWVESPAGLSVDARVRHTGSAWWAEELNKKGNPNGKHWMHFGGEWVSLAELSDSADFEPVLTAGLGNVTVFTSDPLGGEFDVWVLTHPASD